MSQDKSFAQLQILKALGFLGLPTFLHDAGSKLLYEVLHEYAAMIPDQADHVALVWIPLYLVCMFIKPSGTMTQIALVIGVMAEATRRFL